MHAVPTEHFSNFSRNSEANASQFFGENLKEMFSIHIELKWWKQHFLYEVKSNYLRLQCYKDKIDQSQGVLSDFKLWLENIVNR